MENFSRRVFLLLTDSDARKFSAAKATFRLALAGMAGVFLYGCSSSPAPLSIKMYNPETTQTLTCNASDRTAMSDPALLAVAVESCAKQLEARGFVREK